MNSAAQQAEAAAKEISELLAKLAATTAASVEGAKATGRWGHVGDLDHVRQTLRELLQIEG